MGHHWKTVSGAFFSITPEPDGGCNNSYRYGFPDGLSVYEVSREDGLFDYYASLDPLKPGVTPSVKLELDADACSTVTDMLERLTEAQVWALAFQCDPNAASAGPGTPASRRPRTSCANQTRRSKI